MMTDKMKHFLACCAVAALASSLEAGAGASPLLSAMAGFLSGTAIGVGKEYGDRCAPGNRWDWSDIAADVAGSLAGACVGAIVSLLIN